MGPSMFPSSNSLQGFIGTHSLKGNVILFLTIASTLLNVGTNGTELVTLCRKLEAWRKILFEEAGAVTLSSGGWIFFSKEILLHEIILIADAVLAGKVEGSSVDVGHDC